MMVGLQASRNIGHGCRALLGLIPGVWLCCGLLYILPQHGGSGTALPQNITAAGVMALMALVCVWNVPSKVIEMPPGTIMLVLGLLVWSFPLLWTPERGWFFNALPKVAGLWGLVLLFLIVLWSKPEKELRLIWIGIIVTSSIIQALLALKQSHHLELLEGGRPYGGFMQVNVLASYLATGLSAALYLVLTTRNRFLGILAVSGLVILPAMVVLIQSRAGWFGGALSSAMLLWVFRKRAVPKGEITHLLSSQQALLIMAGSIVIGLLWLCYGHHFFPESALSPIGKEGSNAARRYMLHLTLKLIREHPLIGNGYGSFEALYGRLVVLEPDPKGVQSASVAHPHNEFLYTWAEGGVVALAGLFLMAAALIRRLWSHGGMGLAGLALFLPLAVHSSLEYPLYLSASHCMVLVMLLVISGPGVALQPTQNNLSSSRSYRWLVVFIQSIAAMLAMFVLIFMITGLVTQQRLMAIETSGLIPLSEREIEVLSELPNPYALNTRVNFDLHVARLLRFNQTRDPQLLIDFWDWGREYIRTHNDPEVYRSLLKIAQAQHKPEAETLCQQAHGRWPADPGFICAGETRVLE